MGKEDVRDALGDLRHDLRHAFAVPFYQETGDVYAVRKALGHASVGVTERYLRSMDLLDAEGKR